MLKKMEMYKNSWTIDIWSLGCIVLEIVTGVPLWMSIDTRIEDRGGRVTGLFAVKNRVFSKIIQKQIEVVNNLDYHLDNNVKKYPKIELLRHINPIRHSIGPKTDASPIAPRKDIPSLSSKQIRNNMLTYKNPIFLMHNSYFHIIILNNINFINK